MHPDHNSNSATPSAMTKSTEEARDDIEAQLDAALAGLVSEPNFADFSKPQNPPQKPLQQRISEMLARSRSVTGETASTSPQPLPASPHRNTVPQTQPNTPTQTHQFAPTPSPKTPAAPVSTATPKNRRAARLQLLRSLLPTYRTLYPVRGASTARVARPEVIGPKWDGMPMREKFFAAVRACSEKGGHGFHLNLGDTIHKNAVAHASKGDIHRFISDRVVRSLKAAGLADAPLAYAIDVDLKNADQPSGKIHIHGVVVLKEADKGTFREAMRRAGGKTKKGAARQFAYSRADDGGVKIVETPDTLARYILKEGDGRWQRAHKRQIKETLSGQPNIYISRPMIALAKKAL